MLGFPQARQLLRIIHLTSVKAGSLPVAAHQPPVCIPGDVAGRQQRLDEVLTVPVEVGGDNMCVCVCAAHRGQQ